MVGISTSDSAVFGNRQTQSSSAFDLHSWQGLTEVLRVGKESLRDPHAYADFRDLVLQYAQQGGDPELRKQIDAIVVTFSKKNAGNLSPDPQPIPHTEKPTLEAVASQESAPPPQATVTPPEPETSVQKPAVLGTRRVTPIFTRVTSSKQAPLSEKVIPVHPPESPAPEPVVAVATEKPIPSPVTEVQIKENEAEQTAPVEKVDAPIAKSIDHHKARIAEIKKLVNAHVGNPAAIIDAQNENGRLYMSALLGALKATGGGGTEGVESAMAKLEEAYTKIISADPSQKKSSGIQEDVTPQVPQTPSGFATSEVVASASPKEVIFADTPPIETESVSGYAGIAQGEASKETLGGDVPEEPILNVDSIEKEELLSVPPLRELEEEQTTNSASPQKHSVAETLNALLAQHAEPGKAAPHVAHTPAMQVMPHSPSEVQKPPVSKDAPQNQPGFPGNKFTSKEIGKVHNEETLKNVHDVIPSEIKTKQDELETGEITEALNQLLHEWSLFSGSGLFGTGPGGVEHPLYMKLAQLNMGDVIAGKWDGASPNVTKTIKQYVDAWRHEQGVAYLINETFERYLRRVVQRILKRQV